MRECWLISTHLFVLVSKNGKHQVRVLYQGHNKIKCFEYVLQFYFLTCLSLSFPWPGKLFFISNYSSKIVCFYPFHFCSSFLLSKDLEKQMEIYSFYLIEEEVWTSWTQITSYYDYQQLLTSHKEKQPDIVCLNTILPKILFSPKLYFILIEPKFN